MRKWLLLGAAVFTLAGCASFRHAAENECVMQGFSEGSVEYTACVENSYNRRMVRAAAAFGGAPMPLSTPQSAPAPTSSPRPGRFFRSSYISGLNRICIYDRLGSQEIETIPATRICPLN